MYIHIYVVVNFWSAPGSRHVSHLIRNSLRQTIGYAKQSFSLRTSPSCCSRVHSSFWGIHFSEDTLSFKSAVTPRSILPVTSKDGRSNRAHWYSLTFMEFVTLPGHLTFQILQQLLLQRRLIHSVAEITLAIKGIIHSVMKKITTCRSCDY